ncbi:MAG: RsmB/NOP family class I SAM-dependent RNA methyltransferase [Acetobacteraceae bacterium]|nr:RsmB/NOP family class I SAM-dependent RNA methyltransferase [Acetobacteraceae bacterium]
MTPSARFAAAIALLEAIAAAPRRPADATATEFFRSRRYIGGGDRRAISETVWAAIRHTLRLDWHLSRHGATPSPRLRAIAAALLVERLTLPALGALFSDARYGPEPPTAAEQALARALAGRALVCPGMPEHVALNLPEWCLPGFRARFGGALPQAMAAMDEPAPLDLRANLLKTTREAARAALAAEGIATEPTPFSPWGLRAAPRQNVTATQAFREGLVEIQDEGSQLLALLTAARAGERVADLCAGAAGKTLALAAMMGNRGRITACDVSAARLEAAAKRLRRAGADNVERHLLTPGDRWAKRRAGAFDLVLVDAPCTGSGTWRRNPDARLSTTAKDLAEVSEKQAVILDAAVSLLRPGGRLVYATCSLLPEENEVQVERTLARHPALRPVPLAEAWARAAQPPPPPNEGPHLLLAPHSHGTDGFFAAVLERRG